MGNKYRYKYGMAESERSYTESSKSNEVSDKRQSTDIKKGLKI
jgi:hypothetical protein